MNVCQQRLTSGLRRTKQQSERTRQDILGAARKVFARQGVTRTTLEEIAAAAGVTRGAIYWHFADKTELFFAMREQVAVPMIDQIDLALLHADGSDPLAGVERFLRGILRALESDPAARRTVAGRTASVDGCARDLQFRDRPDAAVAARRQRLALAPGRPAADLRSRDRKSTRLNSSHSQISYAVFCL